MEHLFNLRSLSGGIAARITTCGASGEVAPCFTGLLKEIFLDTHVPAGDIASWGEYYVAVALQSVHVLGDA